MKVLTIDFDQTGHRSTYLTNATNAFRKLDADVICFDGSSCTGTEGYEAELSRRVQSFLYRGNRLRFVRKFDSLLKSYITNYITKVVRPDLVYYTTTTKGDWLCRLGCKFQRSNWACTYMTFTDYWNPRIGKAALSTVHGLSACRNNVGIGCLDPRLVNIVANDFPKVFHVPDVCDTSLDDSSNHIGERLRALSNGRLIVSLVGVMDNRKRIQEVIDTIENQSVDHVFWVIAGPLHLQDVDFQQFCRVALRDNVYIHALPISAETDFNRIIATSDIINVRYTDWYHPSNVAIKAAAFKKPIMCFTTGCLGENCNANNLGIAMSPGTTLVEHVESVVNFSCESLDPAGQFVLSNNFQSLTSALSRFIS
jgi:hypothetical protein